MRLTAYEIFQFYRRKIYKAAKTMASGKYDISNFIVERFTKRLKLRSCILIANRDFIVERFTKRLKRFQYLRSKVYILS